MQRNTGKYREIQGNTEKYTEIEGNIENYREIEEFTGRRNRFSSELQLSFETKFKPSQIKGSGIVKENLATLYNRRSDIIFPKHSSSTM